MRIRLALAFLLCLQGSCICSELRRRQNQVTGKNVTSIPSIKEIPGITTNTDSASSDHHPPASTTIDAAGEEISTTSITTRRKAPGRAGIRRNRTQELTSTSPKSSTEEITTTTTEDVSRDEIVTTDPPPPVTSEFFATIEESTSEKETIAIFGTLQANNQTENDTGEGPQENRPAHCSHECASLRRSNAVRYSPLLAKLIHRFSKPGAFDKGKSVFEEEAEIDVTLCPPGDIGLSCRQAEARKGAEECYGGNCEECRTCDETAVTKWPHCCRDSSRCCSQLALACQQCDKPALQAFCSKHFKRCS